MSLHIRPAKPTDVDTAVPLIYSSGPDAFDYVFAHKTKGSAQDFLRHAFVNGRGEFGYKNHVVVEKDGRVVGAGAAYGSDTSLPFFLAGAQQIFTFYGLAGIATAVRGIRTEMIMPPPSDKRLHYIAHLGVSPECRSQGIGAELVAYFLSTAKEENRTIAALDVSVENPRAQALYERLGFVVTKEVPSMLKRELGYVPGGRRMELKL